MRGGGPDCLRSTEESCLSGRGLAATYRVPTAAGYRSSGRLGATSPTQFDGEPSHKGLYTFMKGAGGCCLSRWRHAPRGRDEASTQHRGDGALPCRGGSRDMRVRASRRTTTPTDNRIMVKHIYEFLTLGPGALSQGRNVEKPKGVEQLGIVARRRSNFRGCKARSCRS